jgi:hypothetical protein
LLRNCKKLIRELHFKEKILDNVIEAVCYLQSDLSDTFDHSNPIERNKVSIKMASIYVYILIQINQLTHFLLSVSALGLVIVQRERKIN